MTCIICFLKDDVQSRLRNISRLKCDRFEEAIDEYKKIFVSEFDSLGDISQCPEHGSIRPVTKDWAKELLSSLQEIDDIPSWFEKIKNVYVKWVGGEFSKSLSLLDDMLKERDMFGESNGGEYIFCIRGRKSPSTLIKSDLFHIPFNKRNLVSNQRFSITGLPLLYLGLSPIGIFHELRANNTDLADLYFSSFVLKNPSSLTIANLTNQFPDIYSKFKGLHDIDSPVQFSDPMFGDMKKRCQIEFYKFVLSSVCSFQILERYEGASFVEEYVIPQLLSEKMRQEGYDGICYSSTRMASEDCYTKKAFHTNKYRENVVLFTRYSYSKNYDENLLDEFYISRPVRLPEMIEIQSSEIDKLKHEIVQLNKSSQKVANTDLLSEYSGVTFGVYYDDLMVPDGNNSHIPYREHDFGKIHCFLLYQHMLSVRNWLK